jgi:hypothetical protein
VIELFAVPAGEDEAFLAAWAAEPREAALYRALRDDVPLRYAAVTPKPPAGGVLLIGPVDEHALTLFAGRQGFIGTYRDRDLVAVHWSSPLMHARAIREHGDLMPGAALYSSQRTVST